MAEYPTGPELAAAIPQIDTAELVQQGGQKAVYKANLDGHAVAVKVVAVEIEDSITDEIEADVLEQVLAEADADMSSAVERAKREFDILDQVDIPVLAKRGPVGISMFKTGEARWLYFTEEWIEGITLREMITQSRLTTERVVRLGIDLIQATCWLSSRELVHRDIKPANVMWADNRSKFVLLDTGIALDRKGPSLTRVPVAVGTLPYQSPEQIDHSHKRDLDFRSDLFAIGIVLYEAAVGEHPFMGKGTTSIQLHASILTDSPTPVDEIVADFPSTLSTFISRLIKKEPHFRYRKCVLAQKAIEEIAIGLGVGV